MTDLGVYPSNRQNKAELSIKVNKYSPQNIAEMINSGNVEALELFYKQGKISEDNILSALEKFTPLETSNFLKNLALPSLQQGLFKKITAASPEKAKSIILAFKNDRTRPSEFYESFSSKAFIPALLISSMPIEKQDRIMADLSVIDPNFSKEIKSQQEKFYAYTNLPLKQESNFKMELKTPSENVAVVSQGCYKIIGPNDNTILGTRLGPCIALALYDDKTKTSVLIHLDPAQSVDNVMDNVKSELMQKGIDISRMKAQIVGGWKKFSENCLFNIKYRLNKENIILTNYNYLNPGNTTICLYLEPSSGNIYNLSNETFNEALNLLSNDLF